MQLVRVERVDYFHIELASHDVIFAEGMPAETYVDCGNRGMFHNARGFARLYPGAAPPSWAFCVPRIEGGAAMSPWLAHPRRSPTETVGFADGAALSPRAAAGAR